MTPSVPDTATAAERLRGYAVHVYTASGIAFAFLAMAETMADEPDPVWVFWWLAVTVLIDATDGVLARAWHVKRTAPGLDGRTIDDILDYLTFTFIPLLLVWRMEWLPDPAGLFVVPAMLTSLLGFANVAAKQESAGFFLGFPSYWNIWALYAGIVHATWGPWPNAVIIVALTILTVLPVRFVYPTLAPQPWRLPVMIGAAIWTAVLLFMLGYGYPRVPMWLFWVSLIYPAFYAGISVMLDWQDRVRRAAV